MKYVLKAVGSTLNFEVCFFLKQVGVLTFSPCTESTPVDSVLK